MSLISKPFDSEIYNIPAYPNRKEEIYSYEEEQSDQAHYYDQGFKHGYLHYCRMVPRNISSSSNIKQILIVFCNSIINTSFIGFRIYVSEETLKEECDSLVKFLKRSKMEGFYSLDEQYKYPHHYIFARCQTNAWQLFYRLYEDYLRKPVLTFIGTQFFTHFIISRCIQNEMQLNDVLYKGKIIKVSKKFIYYEIHRKRKISVFQLPRKKICYSSKKSGRRAKKRNLDMKNGSSTSKFIRTSGQSSIIETESETTEKLFELFTEDEFLELKKKVLTLYTKDERKKFPSAFSLRQLIILGKRALRNAEKAPKQITESETTKKLV